MAMLSIAARVYLAAGQFQRRTWGAVKRLHLRLFIHAQHQLPLGRVQIESTMSASLWSTSEFGAELEGLDPMGLPKKPVRIGLRMGRDSV